MGEIARTVGTLLALGVVAVLRAPLAVLPILAVMVVAATFMVTARLTGIAVRDHWRRPAAVDVAVVSGAGVVGSIVFRVGALIFDVRNLVAYGGITIGGAMTASTLTGRRFAAELTVRRGGPRSRAGSSSTRQAGHRRRGPPGGR